MTALRSRLIEAMARAIEPDSFIAPNMIRLYHRDRQRARDWATAALNALAAVLEAEGWQMAPREATYKMREFGAAEIPTETSRLTDDDAAVEIYAAMLAASPNPLAAKEPDNAG